MHQTIEILTQDKIKIIGDYYAVQNSVKGALLVHMMPEARSSWNEFAPKLEDTGYHVLAIDLRGHGESEGGSYHDFTDEQHQASIYDLYAAARFLHEKGAKEIALVGASIGANLALQFLAENPETKAVVLLSAGLEYRGIKIKPLAEKIPEKNKILFVGAEDDADTMGGSCEEIVQALGNPERICFSSGGHGTNLFNSHPELMEKIVEYLQRS